LKEPDQIDVQTKDGSWVKKTVKIGQYKTESNSVKTKTGEMLYFAKPHEVVMKMGDLIDYYRKEIARDDLNPIILAAKFHHDFILIHPFDDGNGRTARILMNFILMQFGFPPAIIKTGDKENYFSALRQADGDDLEPFINYIASNVVHSLEIMIKGAKGEDIEEPSDLDKKLSLLEQSLKSKKTKGKIVKSKEAILNIFDDSILRFFNRSVEECEKFDRFYFRLDFILIAQSSKQSERSRDKGGALEKIKFFIINEELININYFFRYESPREEVLKDGFISSFKINFYETSYEIELNSQTLKNPYDHQLTDEEIDKIIKTESKRHFEHLEKGLK
jgi:fido (protein-threonine AMPylation protein)